MVTCILCGKSFRAITTTHLRKFHRVTIPQYREKFPNAPIYSENRYVRGEDLMGNSCPVCGGEMFEGVCTSALGHELTAFELGLSCLRRYECDLDLASKGPVAAKIVKSQAWSKETRSRIERLFDERSTLGYKNTI